MRNDQPCRALVGTVDDGCPFWAPDWEWPAVCVDCCQLVMPRGSEGE